MWEEPCISGNSGSGTIFFSGCNMGCVFCQNIKIIRGSIGRYTDIGRLIDIFYELEDQGANNINFVTGDIFIPTIRTAIEKSRSMGFSLPFLLNTSSYIKKETLKSLDGLIDIYLPDLKYVRNSDAIRYSNAPGYVETAKEAIEEMVRQQPECVFRQDTDEPILAKGVIVRHLLMPGMLIQAKIAVKYLYDNYKDKIFISLLNQYTPNGNLDDHPEINRRVSDAEYKSLVDYAVNLGIVNGYVQEGEAASDSFIPPFDLTGI